MPSRYTDTLAVMQRGLITTQMRQAAVVGDHLTLDLSYKQYRPQSSTLLTHCGVAPECGHGPDHVELCPERPRARPMLRLARLISDRWRLWRRRCNATASSRVR
jgi:hypothetical protein